MKQFLESSASCIFAALFLGFGLFQLGAGWAGIEDSFGWGWGVAAILAALLFRFTLPIVVGAFLCAKNIWGWHWFFAAVFAALGLLFMIPSLLADIFGSIRGRVR